ncbi:hypothetical protein ARALYDRAFT_897308 [Arabidopsis lyrata subsp. lyrata]|uniref:Leucine-rich repeat-containing N-terminal plant-type domain-containing protein n=1 Tax=Arabidopsis lyrata subsp. lyrata TaxID=81972 RepID=D7L9U3_ARALL|nr:hypothetical protein ARALYDRAFT_897308 [Arabidopsis lyrata subsp. lyrata]
MKGFCNSTSITPITLSFLFLLICIFRDVFAVPTRHLCRPEQRDALLEFKNEFKIGKPILQCTGVHPKTESWTNTSDCCNWEGITCNAISGVVIELDLSCSCFHGKLVASMASYIPIVVFKTFIL